MTDGRKITKTLQRSYEFSDMAPAVVVPRDIEPLEAPAMGQEQLSDKLEGLTRQLSLKDLRRRKVETVRVIERSKLTQALEQLALEGAFGQSGAKAVETGEKKRIAMLVQEVERLGQTKSQLEHDRGLAEAEKNRLQADLDAIAAELGREAGKKFKLDEVRALLSDLRHLRDEREKTRVALDRLQQQAQARIEEELSRTQRLSVERDGLRLTLDESAQEKARLATDMERAARERDEARADRDKLATDVSRLKEEQEDLLDELDTLREERASATSRAREAEETLASFRQMQARHSESFAQLEAQARQVQAELEALKAQALAAEAAKSAPPAEEPAPETRPEPRYETTSRPASPRPGAPGGRGFGFGFGGPAPSTTPRKR